MAGSKINNMYELHRNFIHISHEIMRKFSAASKRHINMPKNYCNNDGFPCIDSDSTNLIVIIMYLSTDSFMRVMSVKFYRQWLYAHVDLGVTHNTEKF
jgi:hypothetical protein